MKDFLKSYSLFLLVYTFFVIATIIHPGSESPWFILGGAFFISIVTSTIYQVLLRKK